MYGFVVLYLGFVVVVGVDGVCYECLYCFGSIVLDLLCVVFLIVELGVYYY